MVCFAGLSFKRFNFIWKFYLDRAFQVVEMQIICLLYNLFCLWAMGKTFSTDHQSMLSSYFFQPKYDTFG